MVIIEALDRFEPKYIKDWELDEMKAGEEKDDYLDQLIEQLQKAGN
jgi:hypothetical protein